MRKWDAVLTSSTVLNDNHSKPSTALSRVAADKWTFENSNIHRDVWVQNQFYKRNFLKSLTKNFRKWQWIIELVFANKRLTNTMVCRATNPLSGVIGWVCCRTTRILRIFAAFTADHRWCKRVSFCAITFRRRVLCVLLAPQEKDHGLLTRQSLKIQNLL